MTVLPEDVAAILEIGKARAPHEACGILLTRRDGGERIAEMDNLAVEPDLTTFKPHQVVEALEELLDVGIEYMGDLAKDLVVWHTHPGGRVGPGKMDMQMKKKLGNTRCLVVTVPTGEAVQF